MTIYKATLTFKVEFTAKTHEEAKQKVLDKLGDIRFPSDASITYELKEQ